MTALPTSIGGVPIVIEYGENTMLALAAAARAEGAANTAAANVATALAGDVAAAEAARDAAAASASVLASSVGTRDVTHGFAGDLSNTSGYLSDPGYTVHGEGSYAKQHLTAPGQLKQLVIDCYSLGSANFRLTVFEGAAIGALNIVSSVALTMASAGKNTFTSAAFGTINLLAGQWWGLSVPSGGPNIYGLRPGDTPTAMNAAYRTTGSAAYAFTDNNMELAARIVVAEAAVSIAGAADSDVASAALGYLLPRELPTQWDAFALTGQSNANGINVGENSLTLPVGIAKQWHAGTLTDITADPVGDAGNVSAWIAFAQDYFSRTGRGVIFITAAVGGTGLICEFGTSGVNWSPTGTLRGAAVAAVTAGMAAFASAGLRCKFAGILWWQGETDAARMDAGANGFDGAAITGAKYTTGLGGLLTYFQSQFGATTQMVLAELGFPASGDTAGFVAIRAATVNFVKANRDAHLAFIAPQASVTEYHYSSTVYNRAGREFARVAAAVCAGRA